MAIKNYTTTVDVYKSLGEIQAALASHGAGRIIIDYNGGHPREIRFVLDTPAGERGFILPAAVDGTLRVFEKQKIKASIDQAERTAWRNVRDWILAQIELVESCGIDMAEPFLPYLDDNNGRTLYEHYRSGQLMLEDKMK